MLTFFICTTIFFYLVAGVLYHHIRKDSIGPRPKDRFDYCIRFICLAIVGFGIILVYEINWIITQYLIKAWDWLFEKRA